MDVVGGPSMEVKSRYERSVAYVQHRSTVMSKVHLELQTTNNQYCLLHSKDDSDAHVIHIPLVLMGSSGYF